MPNYSYVAKTLKGETKTGVLEAENERELARTLRQEGCLLVKIEDKKGEVKKKISISLPFLNRISLAEKLMFTRNLKVMISAGISLPRAIRILAQQSKSPKFHKVLLGIEKEIVEGKSFSESIGNYPEIFPDFFYNMIKVGEEAGTLEEVLGILGQQIEKDYEVRSKIKGAMVYPAVILIAMVGIGILMMILVVPKLSQTFSELGVDLPLTTRVVIGLGNFVAKFWYTIPVFVFVFLTLFRMFVKTKKGKSTMDGFFLRAPLINSLVKKINSARTARTLSSLISAGVPIVRALEVVAGTLSNVFYKEAVLEAAKEVEKGAKLAQALSSYQNIFPNLIIQMIEVGEETGETSGILKKLAEFYEDEVTNATKNLSSIIEPVLMIIIGAAVGFFAISMLQPMYKMLGAL